MDYEMRTQLRHFHWTQRTQRTERLDWFDVKQRIIKDFSLLSINGCNKIMNKLISQQELDVTLVLEDGEIKTSKKLLSSRSDYFSKMFQGNNFQESSSEKVKFPCRKVVMEKIIEYLITGSVVTSWMPLDEKLELINVLRMMLVEDLDKLEDKMFFKPVFHMKVHDLLSMTFAIDILDATLKMNLSISKQIATQIGYNLYHVLSKVEHNNMYLSDEVILAIAEAPTDDHDKFRLYMHYKDTTFAGKEIPRSLKLGRILVEHLRGEVTDSGLFDEETILEAIIEKQDEMLEFECGCYSCNCCNADGYY